MNWCATAAFLLALAVALGAFGAHGLKNHLDAYLMSVWEKAVFYHFVHALGLLLTGLAARAGVLPLSRVYALGALTPLGGLAFIAAWLWLGVELIRFKA